MTLFRPEYWSQVACTWSAERAIEWVSETTPFQRFKKWKVWSFKFKLLQFFVKKQCDHTASPPFPGAPQVSASALQHSCRNGRSINFNGLSMNSFFLLVSLEFCLNEFRQFRMKQICKLEISPPYPSKDSARLASLESWFSVNNGYCHDI